MSKQDIQPFSEGRKPWRPKLQLRHGNSLIKVSYSVGESLVNAAQRIEPSSNLQNNELYVEAKWRLMEFCTWLEPQLHRPVKVVKLKSDVRRVEAFGSFAYSIDYKNQQIDAYETISCEFEKVGNVELGKPLTTFQWLSYALSKQRSQHLYQGSLFVPDHEEYELDRWLCNTTFSLLNKHSDFAKLRNEILPKAFQLPQDIYSIALASRSRPIGAMLDSYTFNTAWRNKAKFKQVARENPQLLPLLLLLAKSKHDNCLPADKDPIRLLKSFFLDASLSEAAWRYVVRHGAKLFSLPWQISGKQNAMEVAINYLRALEHAGLPPPPPPSVVKVWLHSYNGHVDEVVYVKDDFYLPSNNVVLGLALKEANARRREYSFPSFAEEFLGVCWWSEKLRKPLDANQLKAGWPWLLKQANNFDREQKLLAEQKSIHWMNTVGEFEHGEYRVVPIECSADLIQEALAMRNCLHDMVNKCVAGNLQIYSVRDCALGKRKGCIGFVIYENKCAVIWDVKGYANKPPPNDLLNISKQLGLQINKQLNRT